MLALATATTTSVNYGPNLIGGLVGGIIFAVACYFVSRSKGRRPALWAVLGFFFTLIALIIVAVLPSKAAAPTSTY